ncbi:hypothetical protein [Clostridium ihumii]|uniref:hypothetical protein n=1 Tax=Clostridium ihumii TaxID=1470356 RepID=UPI0005911843|nr:hypothetical protein [Clostridium ihumii]
MKVIGFYENRNIRKLKNQYALAEENATKIIANKDINKKAIIILGSLLYIQNTCVYAAESGVMTSMDNLGFKLLETMQWIGRWVCIAMCIKEIIQTALQGGRTKDIGSIFMKYIIIFGSLLLIPKVFMELPAYINN